jgi:hypothetical protein
LDIYDGIDYMTPMTLPYVNVDYVGGGEYCGDTSVWWRMGAGDVKAWIGGRKWSLRIPVYGTRHILMKLHPYSCM